VIDPLHYAAQALIMSCAAILVSVVDDDESVRESLPDLLREFGLASEVFATASDFLRSEFVDRTKCLILDIAMPGMSGFELRRELLRQGHDIPTIFITAHIDFASQPDMREGAVDCLMKPFSETVLLTALRRALNK
jgi:FixJ family two-component response regulator